jgi:uncharacterized protein
MSAATRDLKISDLPQDVSLFPLAGAVLLPDGRLPLNIFEPRYLTMVEDALGVGRYIGMVQPRDTKAETVDDDEAIYQVGCLGRISAFAETDDGRFLITLSGIARFKIQKELGVINGYRRAMVSYDAFANDFERGHVEGFIRQPFVDALQTYFALYEIKGSWEALEKADEATLITSVAMAVPFSPEEKQAILECATLAQQGEMLRSLMEMAAHEKEGASKPIRH